MLKQERPATGTHINRETVVGGMVPMDRDYADLTPDQQEALKRLYENLGPRDEPPFPLRGLASLYKPLQAVGQHLQVSGLLDVIVDVNSAGEAQSVSVYASPDAAMTRAASQILMLQKYKPAVCDGTPCGMQFPVRLDYQRRF